MKLIKILPILLATLFLLSACRSTTEPEITVLKNATADVTHDGENDRIIRQVSGAENGEASLKVYTKIDDTYTLIWMDTLGTKENEQKAIYLCKKSGYYDLLIWKPTTDGDTTTLEYSVFYLDYSNITKKAEPVQELNEKITFTKEQVTKNGDKYEEASDFVYTLNKYISKSAAMIDTVGGEVIYSPTSKEFKTNPYYPDWYDKNYEPKTNSSLTSSTVSNTLPPDSSRIESEVESIDPTENIESIDGAYDDAPETEDTTAEY